MYIPLFQGTTVPALILYCLKLYILLWSMIVGLDSVSPLKTNKTPRPTTTYSDVLIQSLALSLLLHSPFLVCVDAWTDIHKKQNEPKLNGEDFAEIVC